MIHLSKNIINKVQNIRSLLLLDIQNELNLKRKMDQTKINGKNLNDTIEEHEIVTISLKEEYFISSPNLEVSQVIFKTKYHNQSDANVVKTQIATVISKQALPAKKLEHFNEIILDKRLNVTISKMKQTKSISNKYDYALNGFHFLQDAARKLKLVERNQQANILTELSNDKRPTFAHEERHISYLSKKKSKNQTCEICIQVPPKNENKKCVTFSIPKKKSWKEDLNQNMINLKEYLRKNEKNPKVIFEEKKKNDKNNLSVSMCTSSKSDTKTISSVSSHYHETPLSSKIILDENDKENISIRSNNTCSFNNYSKLFFQKKSILNA